MTLGGPPLARHCVAQSTQSWLRVEPTTTGLNVHVETRTEGHLAGDVVLKGVADEAVIHVRAVVEPAQEHEPVPGPAPTDGPPRPPKDQETVVVHTPPPRPRVPPPPTPKQPTGPAEQRTPVARTGPRRAPALAAAAIATAAVITVILAAQAAVDAVVDRSGAGQEGSIETAVREHGVFTPLTISLFTAAAALVLGTLTRHELDSRRELYTKSASNVVQPLTSVTKGVSLTALILAVLMFVTYLVGGNWW